MKDILIQHLSELLTGIIAILLGWFGKGKLTKKVDEADLTARIQNIYKDMIADTDAKIEQLQKEIENLRKNQEQWKTKYRNLKHEFEAYKRKYL